MRLLSLWMVFHCSCFDHMILAVQPTQNWGRLISRPLSTRIRKQCIRFVYRHALYYSWSVKLVLPAPVVYVKSVCQTWIVTSSSMCVGIHVAEHSTCLGVYFRRAECHPPPKRIKNLVLVYVLHVHVHVDAWPFYTCTYKTLFLQIYV